MCVLLAHLPVPLSCVECTYTRMNFDMTVTPYVRALDKDEDVG